MIFKENLTEILDGIRPFLLPLNSYFAFHKNPQFVLTKRSFCLFKAYKKATKDRKRANFLYRLLHVWDKIHTFAIKLKI